MISTTNESIEKGWITTNSGQKFFINDVRKSKILVHDIAYSLSGTGRFCGQAMRQHGRVYSIAEHCLNVSYMVPEEFALVALIHDSTEAFLTDLTTPLKKRCPDFQRIEQETDAYIAEVFGYQYPFPTCVKEADYNMFLAEYAAMFPTKPEDDSIPLPPDEYKQVVFFNYPPDTAYTLFLCRFAQLTQGRK